MLVAASLPQEPTAHEGVIATILPTPSVKTISTECLSYWPPPLEATSTVWEIGDTLEVITSRNLPPDLSRYRRLSKTSYLDNATGEICTYRPKDKPAIPSVNRSFGKLHRLIVGNFKDNGGIMLTLTVADDFPATPSDLYSYYSRFWRMLKHHFPLLEYLSVIEPHQSGRFHLHVLVKVQEGPVPTVDSKLFRQWWAVGAVNIRQIYDVAGLAGYLTSKRKRRSWYRAYAPGTRLWRSSKGISRPRQQRMSRKELETYAESNGYNFTEGYRLNVLYDDGGKSSIVNTVTHELFKRE